MNLIVCVLCKLTNNGICMYNIVYMNTYQCYIEGIVQYYK